MSRTYAFAPADLIPTHVVKGDASTFIDLGVVPIDAPEWSVGDAGTGVIRLHGDGSVELLEWTADVTTGGFKLTPDDWAELQASLEPGYW